MIRLSRLAAFAVAAVSYLAPAAPVRARGVPEPIRACAKEADDARRLACYDREVGSGLHADPADEPIRATVTRIVERNDGTLLITLHNGQRWAQKNRDYFPLKTGDVVTVRGGAFSSVHLVTESGRSTQVKRVR